MGEARYGPRVEFVEEGMLPIAHSRSNDNFPAMRPNNICTPDMRIWAHRALDVQTVPTAPTARTLTAHFVYSPFAYGVAVDAV
jgi:hypothetical protein